MEQFYVLSKILCRFEIAFCMSETLFQIQRNEFSFYKRFDFILWSADSNLFIVQLKFSKSSKVLLWFKHYVLKCQDLRL